MSRARSRNRWKVLQLQMPRRPKGIGARLDNSTALCSPLQHISDDTIHLLFRDEAWRCGGRGCGGPSAAAVSAHSRAGAAAGARTEGHLPPGQPALPADSSGSGDLLGRGSRCSPASRAGPTASAVRGGPGHDSSRGVKMHYIHKQR